MLSPPGLASHAVLAQLVERCAGPARSILGYQELALEEARELGLDEATPDLERVREAAEALSALVARLVEEQPPDVADGVTPEAQLRHDLRTPINAVLGYTEMVIEDFENRLSERLRADLDAVAREARRLLDRIDEVIDAARADAGAAEADAAALSVAADLARTLAAPPQASAAEPALILVVDDVEANRELLGRRLERLGHRAAAAASGRAALKLLAEREFDLALVDILMPDMNGLELLRRMKADAALRDIPVLMVSGLRDESAVIGCVKAGAEDYLPKPVDPVLLRARIESSLERRRWRARERRYLERIEFEKERADALLEAMLPGQVVRRLAGGEAVIADRFEAVTVVFADIVDFSPLAAKIAPSALVRRLGRLFSRFDEIADACGVEKIKTIGDAYMAVSGAPEPREDHADAALAFASALLWECRSGPEAFASGLRIGVHSGPAIAGLIGRKRFVYDLWGHTVNVAARLESYGEPGRIHLSRSVLDALRAPVSAAPRGRMRMKGVGLVESYVLEGAVASGADGLAGRSDER